MLVYLLTVLDVDFTIESPVGFAGHLTAVAKRYARAAATSAATAGATPTP